MSVRKSAAVALAMFSAGRLFGVTFNGVVYEIPGGFDPDARTAAP